MKISFLTVLFIFCKIALHAQLNLPELSPEGKIFQKAGLTMINIHYGRPAARERKIMGDVVPYNTLWRTGAGKCSTISFDNDVVINNTKISAGIYAILTIPAEKKWTVLFNSDTSKAYGDPREYDEKTEVLRFTAIPKKTDRFYESLSIDIDVVRNDAVLYLAWENTQINFLIATGSHQKAMAGIEEAIESNPNNQDILSMASYYYFMNNEDPEKILKWLNMALALGEERWVYHQKVDVLERIKNYNEARKTAQAAIGFLTRTKPVEWESSVRGYEARMKKWLIRN
jgi:tetratricopeptide (TPR) repeat protein